MEIILYILVGFVVVTIYFVIADFISGNYKKARGFDKVFWFLILMVTFSWLFSSSSSSSSSNYYGDEYDEDNNFNFWGNDNDYNSCSWDNDSSSWDCDDD